MSDDLAPGAPKRELESIVIGGVEIKPDTRAAIDIPIASLSTRAPMSMPVKVLRGRYSGPRLFVGAAIHGDEINGVEIIRRLLRLTAFKALRGTLILIPIVNVLGFMNQSRYLPDRRDLNRVFPGSPSGSLAGRLAHTFTTEIIAKSTHGIDLHTGAIHRENFPQIRANFDEPEAERMALKFGVPIAINTSYREGSLRQAASELSVPVIVYEAGEALRFNESCVRAGVKGVGRVMRELGMLPPSRRQSTHRKPLIIGSSVWVRAPGSGLLRTTTALGSAVRKDELLGAISDPFGENEIELRSSADGIVIGRTNLPLVHEGDALFHVAKHEGKQVVAKSLESFEPGAEYELGLTSELVDDLPIV